jgi:2,3-diaminopropionate biosynthesis protein SbnA
MTVIDRADAFNVGNLFVDLAPVLGEPLLLKCEGLNFAGSIKLKTAVGLLDRAEATGLVSPGRTTLVESSSGNLGIGIGIAAASRGYRFICVTDSRCNQGAIKMMRALGVTVEVVTQPHPRLGLLGARLDRVRDLVTSGADHVWLNQYENSANWQAHRDSTGPEILRELGRVDTVFVGVGTSGTAMGVARYLREASPGTRVVGVDVEGSVSFGGPAGTRYVAGIGSSIRPPLLDVSLLDAVVYVSEQDSVRACRSLVRHGYLFGGSTGSVVAGARSWLRDEGLGPGTVNVAIAPDLGERYLDTVYRDDWAHDVLGMATLDELDGELEDGLEDGLDDDLLGDELGDELSHVTVPERV